MRYTVQTPALTPEVRALLTVGFCGGYTTFSTFSYEAAALIQDGNYRRALAYMAASVTVSLAGTFLGCAAAGALVAVRRGV